MFLHNSTLLYSTGYVAPGLYIRALCDGMDQALEPFREEIIELERIVLNDSYTPLSLILCNVEKYTCLFSLLHSIIREVIINFYTVNACIYSLRKNLSNTQNIFIILNEFKSIKINLLIIIKYNLCIKMSGGKKERDY